MIKLPNDVTMTAVPGNKTSPWGDVAYHFRVTLKCSGRTMSLDFWQGAACTNPPTLSDVLDCLLSDASGVISGERFGDWCGDYGYDTDSRKAEQTFRAIKRQTARLATLLGGQHVLDVAVETMNDDD